MPYLYDFTLILMKFSKFGGNFHWFNFVAVNTECRIYCVVVYIIYDVKLQDYLWQTWWESPKHVIWLT